jgi:hypothetical protein
MKSILRQIESLRDEINCTDTTNTSAILDRVSVLADIVGDIVVEIQEMKEATARAANVASCLANGIKPD